ncbi:MAG: transposase [Phycisphaerales bacterium]|nr:transposase [Phycisphaerales bacterium]
MLFLQHVYNLSDECLEEFVIDNLSFQQFIGLHNSDSVPDFTTYWRFKEKIIANKLGDKIWDAINKQLQAQGATIEHGSITLIDATIIKSTQKPLSKEERVELEKNWSSLFCGE